MKRYLLIVLAVVLSSCFLISCNPEAEDVRRTDPAIVGTWTCTEEKSPGATYTWNLTINNDGTYIMDELFNEEPDPSQTHKGTYSADGSKWVGTVTNISEFEPIYTYTSEHPCYGFRNKEDDTHWKLEFNDELENPESYKNTYEWDASNQRYLLEENTDSKYYCDYYKIGDTSYEENTTNITKDESGNEKYKMEMIYIAKAEAFEDPSADKVFAKIYDFYKDKCSWKITSSYKKDGDTLSFYWLGSEKTFTKK